MNCAFDEGKLYALVGKSGSGKSTLLSLMAGLMLPTEGEIVFEGRPTSSINLDKYRRENAAVIYQSFRLLPLLTVTENVTYPMELRGFKGKKAREKAAELIEKIANELGLEYSIDPSNDSQNEYARVVTIRKDGKLIGRINSDAKTDVGDAPSLGWIIGGGILIGAAAVFAVVLVIFTERKKKKAVSNGSK